MKTLRKFIYLIFGLFLIGFASCANDSGSDKPEELLDKNNLSYRDGLYKYDDGYTQMYLYYFYKNLYYAGNESDEYDASRLNILKKSYLWANVHQYCSGADDSACSWLLEKKAFKKGWYVFSHPFGSPEYNRSQLPYYGYFESSDASMVWTRVTEYDEIYGKHMVDYRTKNFSNNECYSSRTWKELTEYCHFPMYSYQGDNLDSYPNKEDSNGE